MIREAAPTIVDHDRRLPSPATDEPPAASSATTLLVVRHGHAGDRERWEGPDEVRPLTKKGRRQAAGLVGLLAEQEIVRIVSSHYVRCLETVVPLACDRHRDIEVHPALAEGASVLDASALIAELAGTTAVLCTHGDVVWNILVGLAHEPDGGDELHMAKGSTWVVEERDGRLAAVSYLAPPS